MTQLTPEFAETVELPLNPVKRHLEVARLLSNSVVPGEVSIEFVGTYPIVVVSEVTLDAAAIYGVYPLMRRRTLKRVAAAIENVTEGEE